MSSYFDQLEAISRGIEQLVRPIRSMAEGVALYHVAATVHETSGWLPYRTVPFAQYVHESGGDLSVTSARVETYYLENSQSVLADIECKLTAYHVDDEAKATLREALRAHAYNLYRCSPRLLLPEIERIIRQDWFGVEGIATMGLKRFTAEVDEKYLNDFVLEGSYELVLFNQLINHLFSRVNDIVQVQEEPTPNRHAAAHGWVAYASPKNSLNAIICADYAYRLVSSFKTDPAE